VVWVPVVGVLGWVFEGNMELLEVATAGVVTVEFGLLFERSCWSPCLHPLVPKMTAAIIRTRIMIRIVMKVRRLIFFNKLLLP
jgi:hypothetical protein